MNVLDWLFVLGGLLLATSLASGWLHRSPVTPFALYAATGIVLGPWGLQQTQVDLTTMATALRRATEFVLVVSLFMTGLKLRLHWRHAAWRHGLLLAGPAMLLTIGGVALAAHALFDFSWPLAIMLGAMVAPTDPVMASLVAVGHAGDDDAVRSALSGEAGLNDGAALPLLLLGLLLYHDHAAIAHWPRWLLLDVVWALPAGLAIGYGFGRVIGRVATKLKMMSSDNAPNDFLALALIVLTYTSAEAVHASGYLAAFAAGLGLRRTEWDVVARYPSSRLQRDENEKRDPFDHPPAEVLINPNQRHSEAPDEPATSIGMVVSDALSFGDTLERLIAASLVLLLGVAFATHWSLEGALLALLLFFLIRPAGVVLSTFGTEANWPRRLLLGWLGIRGIGSLNYLAYAMTHGLGDGDARRITSVVVTVVLLSVLVHGVTAQPLLAWRHAQLQRGR